MADYFMSAQDEYDLLSKAPDHVGTSSTAGDKVELRFDQALTGRQVLNTMKRFERWLIQNGLNNAGASLPVNRG